MSFFVRDNLGQQPGQPGTAFSASPDIILAGAQPALDPAQFATPAGYATDYGGVVVQAQPNFVYLRALGTGAPPQSGRAWLFYTDSALALWPSQWRGDMIEVAGNPANYQAVTASAQDQVCQPDLPFVWMPPFEQPGSHYCMISWWESPPAEPPTSPVEGLPAFTTFDALVTFVLDHPQMGWRNVVDVSQAGPDWTQTTSLTGPTPAQPFLIGVQCHDMPTDGAFSFMVPGPTPDIPTIVMPASGRQPILNPDFQCMAMVSDWPSGAQSSITLNYWQGATAPPQGATITVILTIPAEQASTELTERVRAERPDLLHRPAAMAAGEGTEKTEERLSEGIVIGAVTYRF